MVCSLQRFVSYDSDPHDIPLWQAFGGDGGLQKVAEYDDRLSVDRCGKNKMQLFYMCGNCGIYMPSKMCDVKGLELTAGQRWYCRLNGFEFQKEHPQNGKSWWRNMALPKP